MEILKAIFLAGLPTALLGFALVYWAIKKNYITSEETVDRLKEKNKHAKANNIEFTLNPVHKKWLYFGGGYYGSMALSTYVYVELLEIIDFISAYSSIADLIEQISVSALIGFVIDTFLNIIPAFTWFIYWPKVISMQNGWYWLFASYFGYQLGSYLAKWVLNRG